MSNDVLEVRLNSMYPEQDISIVKVDGDQCAIHYAYYEEEKMVGTISLFIKSIPFQIRKVAVLPEYQGKGIGSELIKTIIDSFDECIFLNARIDKVSFYEKLGFAKVNGSEFNKNGFVLIRMNYSN